MRERTCGDRKEIITITSTHIRAHTLYYMKYESNSARAGQSYVRYDTRKLQSFTRERELPHDPPDGRLCGVPAHGPRTGTHRHRELWCLRHAGALAWRRGPVCACLLVAAEYYIHTWYIIHLWLDDDC